ncbi:MAG TPA: sensor histidine kinase, partial [Sediminibacterium sp.]|nr:sensor histidine kinase [Sediminibacterium sp.]
NNDYRNIGISQINLTNVYVNLLDYPKALEYLEKAKANFEKSNFKRGVVVCYNNLGAINIRLERYEDAIPHLKKALEISQENQSKQGVALVQQNIGHAYTLLKNYPDALNWMVDAEKTAIQYGADQYTFGEIYNHRAMLDSAMGNYQGAFNYRSKYVAINDKSLNERVTRQVAETQTKYEVEKKELRISLLNKTDSIKSLQISNQQLALLDADLQITQDSLELRTKNEIILQNRLDSTQKEEKIRTLDNEKRIQLLVLKNQDLALTRRNQTIIGISILAALLLLSGYLYYKQRVARQEQQSQKALAEQQERATVAIIEAEEKERKRIASDLHDGVGQLMTAAWMNLQALDEEMKDIQSPTYPMFNKTLELVKESCNEVRQVSHNMMPNALLRKGLVNAVREFISQLNTGKLSIHLATEELKNPLPSHVETILYRVIQESVNNVVKHAQASVLDISINQDGAGIDVMIEDNGKGFDTTITRPTDGIGLQNISSRIQYLKGTVEWDSAPGRGTLVAIHIPFNA